MADIKWKEPAIDGAIAVGGGFLLENALKGVTQLQSFLGMVPDFGGINSSVLVLGAAALVLYKNIVK